MEKYDGDNSHSLTDANTDTAPRQRKAEAVMYDLGLWLAAGIGALSLWLGNRTAIPLLASFLISSALCYSGVPFDLFFWLLIDFAVILAIISRHLKYTDLIILCLFFPAWVAYWLPGDMRASIVWAVVVGQFLLTFPLVKVIACISRKIEANKGRGGGMEFSYG